MARRSPARRRWPRMAVFWLVGIQVKPWGPRPGRRGGGRGCPPPAERTGNAMKAAPQGHGSRRYLWLVVAVLAGLWLAAGSVSAVSPAGNETGDKVAPRLASAPVAIHLPLSSGLASPAETPASALVAHVTWQGIGQPNHRNTTETLTLTLRLNSGGP